jgi:hypothetical protein
MVGRSVLVGLWCLAGAISGYSQSSTYSYYLTQAADGPVANGTLRTAITVVNIGTATATVGIAATRNDGSAMRFSVPSPTKLAVGATRVFLSDGTGDGSTGAVSVTSDGPLTVSGLVSYSTSAGAPLSESGEAAVNGQSLTTEYLLPVDTTGNLNSGVSLLNPGPGAASVTIKLRNAAGQSAGSAIINVPAGGHASRFARGDLFPGLGDFRGSMDVLSTVNIAAGGLRQVGGSAGFTLISAAPVTSRGMRFFFPQVSEGAVATGGSVHTTFLITNVSAVSAAVSVTLTKDDGSPYNGMLEAHGCEVLAHRQSPPDPRPCRTSRKIGVPASTFQTQVPPGASVFWRTFSGGSQATAAATIQSSSPVGVSAVVASYDSSGSVVSETGLASVIGNYHFAVPFQSDSATSAGAAFYNSGARAITLTLNLVDPDDKSLAASKSVTLAPGARTAGLVAEFFPGSAATTGAITATTGGAIDSTLAAASLRRKTTGESLSISPAAGLPMIVNGPTPPVVTPTLDTARAASASISTAGGSLAATDAKGNRFTLTIPAGALLNRETITMTPVISATGLSGSGVVAAVQLDPDGLGLMQPAQLKIEFATPPPAGTLPLGWRNQTPGVYLNMVNPKQQALTLSLLHFSGAGAGGGDLTSMLITIANQLDLIQSVASYIEDQIRQETLSGNDADAAIDSQRLQDAFDLGYDTVVEPMMELAQASDDEDVLRCAATQAIGYSRQLQLMGFGDDPRVDEIQEFLSYAMSRAAQKIQKRCQDHDPTAYFNAVAAERQGQLLGVPTNIDISACPPAFELDFTSEIQGNVTIGVTGTFDIVLSGKITMKGQLTKDVLTQIVDPSKDLYTSFPLSGSIIEQFDKFSVNIPPDPKSGCVESPSATTPDTMTVKPGSDPQLSQAQYKFNPQYNPQAVTANGQQLCSFCPVYKTTPVKVELWMDPGKPSESVLSKCSAGSMTISTNFWWAGWVLNHQTDNGFITGWDLVNTPSIFAQKNISQTVSNSGTTLSEHTDLKLKPLGGAGQ